MKFFKIFILPLVLLLQSGLLFNAMSAQLDILSATTSSPLAWGTVGMAYDGTTHPDFNLAPGAWDGTHPQWSGDKSIRFELTVESQVTGFNLWNNGGLGTLDPASGLYSGENDGEGINEFALLFYDSSLNLFASYTNFANDFFPQQFFDFAPGVADAKYIDLVIRSNHFAAHVAAGDANGQAGVRDYAVFREISFEGTPSSVVPEPGTMMLFGIGLLGCSGLIRRKRRGLI